MYRRSRWSTSTRTGEGTTRRSRVPVSSDAHSSWLSSSPSNAATIAPVSRISEMARARRRLRWPACSGRLVPSGTPRCRSGAAVRLRPRSAAVLPDRSHAPGHRGRAEGLPRHARELPAALAQAARLRSRRWLFPWSPYRHGSGGVLISVMARDWARSRHPPPRRPRISGPQSRRRPSPPRPPDHVQADSNAVAPPQRDLASTAHASGQELVRRMDRSKGVRDEHRCPDRPRHLDADPQRRRRPLSRVAEQRRKGGRHLLLRCKTRALGVGTAPARREPALHRKPLHGSISPRTPNTLGGETNSPERLALEVQRWVGGMTLIRNGYVLNLRAIRAVTLPGRGEYELRSGAVFVAQIVPTEEGPEHPASIFCEFTRAVQHGETLRFPPGRRGRSRRDSDHVRNGERCGRHPRRLGVLRLQGRRDRPPACRIRSRIDERPPRGGRRP